MAVVAIIDSDEAIAEETIFTCSNQRHNFRTLKLKGYANNNNSYLYVQFVLIGFAN